MHAGEGEGSFEEPPESTHVHSLDLRFCLQKGNQATSS